MLSGKGRNRISPVPESDEKEKLNVKFNDENGISVESFSSITENVQNGDVRIKSPAIENVKNSTLRKRRRRSVQSDDSDYGLRKLIENRRQPGNWTKSLTQRKL